MVSIESLKGIAIREAHKSKHKYRIGAVIYRRKEIIALSCNKPYRHCARIKKKYKSYPTSIHAEIGAVLKARKDLCGTSILVVRINAAGQLRLAKPCKHCHAYLDYVGIKRVIYSTNEGIMKEMRI